MAWCEIAGMHCAIIIHRAAYAYSMHSCTVRSCSFVTALVAHTQLVYIQLHACPCTTCAKYIICRHMHYICAHVILLWCTGDVSLLQAIDVIFVQLCEGCLAMQLKSLCHRLRASCQKV